MNQKVILLFSIVLIFSCKPHKDNGLTPGIWHAELLVSKTQVLPFNFEVTSDSTLKIFNAEEVIFIDDITYSNDSVYIKMPVFEGYIAAKIEDGKLNGSFIKESLERIVPFTAEANNSKRFEIENPKANFNVSGNWETLFSKGIAGDEYIAKGIFVQEGEKVTGTFRTTTGDYRYLEGVLNGDQLALSTFDGSHAFLFTATVTDSTMSGTFYSGNHWKEPFVAKRNETFELPDANTLTFLNEGYDQVEFTFPNAKGEMISLSDEQFKDKVVLVQIMGTWCPNCLDESKFYSEFYKNNKDKEFEIVALAFEYAKTQEDAFKSIARLQDNIGLEYPVLLAQYGTSDKAKAQEKLPMLNHVLSYPTTIYIDKKGTVRRIHTGFNGPATGEKYMEFKNEFEEFIAALLKE
jgi:peroxiredoxin